MNMTEKEVKDAEVKDAEVKEEGKAKQVESMKAKWLEPEYKARVSLGRHAKSMLKLEDEIGEFQGQERPADEKEAKEYDTKLANLYKRRDFARSKVEEAKVILGAEEIEAKFAELQNPEGVKTEAVAATPIEQGDCAEEAFETEDAVEGTLE